MFNTLIFTPRDYCTEWEGTVEIVVNGAENITVFDKNLAIKIIKPGRPKKVDVFYVWKEVSKINF